MAKQGIFNQSSSPKPGKVKQKTPNGIENKVAGVNYGTGSKNPMGRMRDGSMGQNPVPKKKLGKPPRALA